MSIRYTVISIGTLSVHPLWNERIPVRTGHATTTLVQTERANILVDPSLPAPMLVAQMSERTTVKPDEVTHVFLTSLATEVCRGLPVFEGATWLVHEPELSVARTQLKEDLQEARGARDAELIEHYEKEADLLERCEPAPDRLAQGIDLFPLPGVTPGTCGLLLALPRLTVLICGDAVPTTEHLEQGKVLPHCHNFEQAQESFADAVEIADLLILGRDNIVPNPLRGAV
ncbi:MAG: MBL fold metallo-hydrolase [Planctomycetota bacterium]|jgi:glyoxylase-like metal-dependent hydrolase (beta-lactamase superfamily II)